MFICIKKTIACVTNDVTMATWMGGMYAPPNVGEPRVHPSSTVRLGQVDKLEHDGQEWDPKLEHSVLLGSLHGPHAGEGEGLAR